MKSDLKSKLKKDAVHLRTRYTDHSRQFLEWVNSLGFEQTYIGTLIFEVDRRFSLRRVCALFLFCLFLSFLIFSELDFDSSVRVGEVVATDIKSPISMTIIDEVATEKKRIDAELSAPPVFDYDPDIYEEIISRNYRAFAHMRDLIRPVTWSKGGSLERDEKIKEFLKNKTQFEEELSLSTSDRLFEWLAESRFSVAIESALRRSLEKWQVNMIVDGLEKSLRATDQKLIVRRVSVNQARDEFAVNRDGILDLSKKSNFPLANPERFKGMDSRFVANLQRLAHSMLAPNLTFNKQETAERRQKARDAVLPVQISIEKNQIIVGAGQVVQPLHRTILNEIESLKSDRNVDFVSLVSALLFVIVILSLLSFLRRFTEHKVQVEIKDLLAMGLSCVLVVLVTKMFLFFTDAAFISRMGPSLPPKLFLYAAPFAMGSMLVGLVLSMGEVVWLYTVFQSVVLATMVDMDFNFLIVALVGSTAAARGVFKCEKRSDIYWAGVRTGLVNALTITTLLTLNRFSDSSVWSMVAYLAPAGFVSGLLSAVFSMGIVPLVETLFNYTTDVKLLELSNLNHPLMQQMVVKAPGTYQHSLAVGSMVEAAAQEINANPLLAKVMAFYHDIGKMEHAQYFVENQRPGLNPHDNISPHLSKTILIAHVKDGAEMGLKYKLGKPIIDGILQHHGTTLISFFYNRALEEQDESLESIEKDDFRYPGPKPQFKEAALVMLADSIEAAARCIEEPTSGRLTALVTNIIQGKFMDGQLDECNLTFRELSLIEKSFIQVILSIYHHRIDYPAQGGFASLKSKKTPSQRTNFTA